MSKTVKVIFWIVAVVAIATLALSIMNYRETAKLKTEVEPAGIAE